MRGGAPIRWVKPLNADGNLEEGFTGCYRGNFEHWNVKLKVPGFVTRVVNKRNVARRKRMGWIVATPEYVESLGGEEIERRRFSNAVIETENMVMMLAPIKVVEANQADIKRRSDASLAHPTAEFINRGTTSEATFSQQANGRPIRFAE
jgi:hypothetical protein